MKRTVALGLIGIGVLWLLGALALLPYSPGFYISIYWPILLILAGMEIMFHRWHRGRGGVFFPTVLWFLGIILLLENLHLLGFGAMNPFGIIIAVILIYFGFTILNFSFKNRWQRHWNGIFGSFDRAIDWDDPNQFQTKKKSNRVGEIRYGDQPWQLEPLTIRHTLGSVRINLGTATIPVGQTPIHIVSDLGEVRIYVPDGVSVDAEVLVKIGHIQVLDRHQGGVSCAVGYQDQGYDNAERRVKIRVRLQMGDVQIVRGI